MALRLDIRRTPKARVTVVTIGRPSGIAATASDTVLHQVSLRNKTFEGAQFDVPPMVNISNHGLL